MQSQCFPGVISPDLHSGRGRPLLHLAPGSNPDTNFRRALRRSHCSSFTKRPLVFLYTVFSYTALFGTNISKSAYTALLITAVSCSLCHRCHSYMFITKTYGTTVLLSLTHLIIDRRLATVAAKERRFCGVRRCRRRRRSYIRPRPR